MTNEWAEYDKAVSQGSGTPPPPPPPPVATLFPDDEDDGPSLREAREKLLVDRWEGVSCPCCGQMAKVYRRKINSSMARGLIAAYRENGLTFGWLQDVRRMQGETDNREESKLRYWGLMEEEPERRPDGGRSGWWRVTSEGEAFVRGQIRVPKYAFLYDGFCLRLDHGEMVTISDALGTPFNYDDLMKGI